LIAGLDPRIPVSAKDDTYLSTIVGNRLPRNNTTTYTYDAASNLLTVVRSTRLQSIFTYTPLERLMQLTTPVSSCGYQLGAVGNWTAMTEGNGRTLNWNYDGVYWLTNETISAGPARANRTVAYGLDPVGNRKSETSTFSDLNPGLVQLQRRGRGGDGQLRPEREHHLNGWQGLDV
jgi:YD repeat-containing protein